MFTPPAFPLDDKRARYIFQTTCDVWENALVPVFRAMPYVNVWHGVTRGTNLFSSPTCRDWRQGPDAQGVNKIWADILQMF